LVSGGSAFQHRDLLVFAYVLADKPSGIFYPVFGAEYEDFLEFSAEAEFFNGVEDYRLSAYVYVLLRFFAAHAAAYAAGQYACIYHVVSFRLKRRYASFLGSSGCSMSVSRISSM